MRSTGAGSSPNLRPRTLRASRAAAPMRSVDRTRATRPEDYAAQVMEQLQRADPPETTARPTCGAKRSRGRGFCRSRALYPNGRCHFHGGPSTGPKTAAGLARSLAALARAREVRQAAKRAASPAGRIEALAAQGLSVAAICEASGLDRDLVRRVLLEAAEAARTNREPDMSGVATSAAGSNTCVKSPA